jgi:hypothetical protein
MTYTAYPGVSTSVDADAYKKAITLADIDLRTPENMDFAPAVIMETTDKLDLHFQLAKTNTVPVFRITEGQTTPRQRVGWFDDATTLYGYRGAIEVSETVQARGDYNMQWNESLNAVINGFTMARDQEILSSLYAGANTANTTDANTEWSDQSGKNILGDVASALRKVFKNQSNGFNEIKTNELSNMMLFYPSKLVMDMDLPELMFDNGTAGGQMGYNIPNETQNSFLKRARVTPIPTSRLNGETFALGVIRSPKCAVHYSYEGPMRRIRDYSNPDEGTDGYMITQYFRTKIVPQSPTQTSSNDRLFIINGIADA